MKQLTILLLVLSSAAIAQKKKGETAGKGFVQADIESKKQTYVQAARAIWSHAELGYLETKSTALLQQMLSQAGFSVESGVAGMPTAFVASYGSGQPVIGILAEFDALPGLSQDSVPLRKPLVEGGSGHGCGHNLFGVGSAAAAIALKNWLQQQGRSGTIRLYGTPAEEGGSGKVYMVRAGLFSEVEAVLHWHPSSANQASPESCLAVKQGTFRFRGKAAHAAMAPHVGRSALDGVESMNYMANMMREHVPQETRIHYIISKGGVAPNVVPEVAEVEYVVRHPDAKTLEDIWQRLVKCAEGAALGTETSMQVEIASGSYNLLPNDPLARVMQTNLQTVGGVSYSASDRAFAEKLQQTFSYAAPPLATAQQVEPYKTGGFFPASTDVGDVSWVVPTAGLGIATWVPGTVAHSWQAVACDGMSIGFNGMMNAAKVLAMTGVDLFTNPGTLQEARKELEKRRGNNFSYRALLGDRKPPLDYRKGR